jgi:hypothetical protein
VPNEMVAVLRPRDFYRLNGGYPDDSCLVQRGSVAGLRLLKSDTQGFTAVTAINAEHTMGTGLTLSIGVLDDGTDAADLGRVVRLGVTVKTLATGADTLDIATSAATEQTVDVTLDATAGEIVLASLAIANANLDSAAVGSTILIRVRRIGAASQDTCQGTAVLTHVYIRNT